MSLATWVRREWSAVGLVVDGRDELFRWVTERMVETGFLEDAEGAVRRLVERERIMSTAIFPGVAVPHARCPDARGVGISAVLLSRPIDFGAQDGKPVKLVFTLLGPPEATAEHVQALGAIAKVVRDQQRLQRLLEAPDLDSFLAELTA